MLIRQLVRLAGFLGNPIPVNTAWMLVRAIRIAVRLPVEGLPDHDADLQRLADDTARVQARQRQVITRLRQESTQLRREIRRLRQQFEGQQPVAAQLQQGVNRQREEAAVLRRNINRCSVIAAKAYNRSCGNGINRNYEVVPFQDGSMPTEQQRNRAPLPALRTHVLTNRQLGRYLRGYGVQPVPRGIAARRTCLSRAIGLSDPFVLVHNLEA